MVRVGLLEGVEFTISVGEQDEWVVFDFIIDSVSIFFDDLDFLDLSILFWEIEFSEFWAVLLDIQFGFIDAVIVIVDSDLFSF